MLVITPPEPLITWDEADAQLNLSGDTSEQGLVELYIKAVSAHLDGPEGWLGRAVGVQTLEARGRYFSESEFDLPRPPVISVTSVKYLDTEGVEQLLDSEIYEPRGDTIVRAHGKSWPAVRSDAESVRVRYQAGYAEVPWPIKAAAMLMIGDLFANRETVTDLQSSRIVMSATVESLLSPYRIWA
ncbi:MAG TPA: head-tail connector protein [Xanthobacteraceae bacterium]|nr:head-tail connector protein [Xanthobacteraceae bacterium]